MTKYESSYSAIPYMIWHLLHRDRSQLHTDVANRLSVDFRPCCQCCLKALDATASRSAKQLPTTMNTTTSTPKLFWAMLVLAQNSRLTYTKFAQSSICQPRPSPALLFTGNGSPTFASARPLLNWPFTPSRSLAGNGPSDDLTPGCLISIPAQLQWRWPGLIPSLTSVGQTWVTEFKKIPSILSQTSHLT